MNKELFSFLLVTIALLLGAFSYNNIIQSPVINSLNFFKKNYHDTTQYINDTLDTYFFQTHKIRDLKEQLQKYENNHLVMQELANEVNDLYNIQDANFTLSPQIALVRAISYEKFGNFNRLWMDIPDYNGSKIYGLTYKELVAGIVINKNSRPLALLNQDIKSAYSVFVGEKSAPGIAHGNNNKNLIVSFIPTFYNIKVGDEVTTSGLDDIFIKGLRVGKVLSVNSSQGYQNAIIEPYYKNFEPNYFHIIKRVR